MPNKTGEIMRKGNTRYAVGAVLLSLTILLAACEFDVEEKGTAPDVDVSVEGGQLPEYEMQKTQEGKLPEVDVDVDPGKLPEVDVRGPKIRVEQETVTVPDVDVQVKEKEIQIPTLDVELPDEYAE